jgi:uncharacterized damage-inducible protein DinB
LVKRDCVKEKSKLAARPAPRWRGRQDRRPSSGEAAMKIILAVLVLGLFCPTLAQEEGRMTAGEKTKVIKLLLDSQKELLDSVEKLSDAQWNYKPGPDRWSVGEVAEHILLSEGLLFASVERALAEKTNPEWKTKTAGKTEFLERVMVSRDRRAQAPEQIRPQGLSRAEIMSRFKEARAKTLKFAEQTELPLKAHTLDHPFPVFSTLNAYQWLIYIPLHNLRHNQQIAEVKASAEFPK